MKKFLIFLIIVLVSIGNISPSLSLLSPLREGVQTDFKTRSGEISYDYTHDMFFYDNATPSCCLFGDIISTVFTVDGANIQFNYTFHCNFTEFFSGNAGYDQIITFILYYPEGYRESINNITEILLYSTISEFENTSIYLIMSMNYTDYISGDLFGDLTTRCLVDINFCEIDYSTGTLYFTTSNSGLIYDDNSPVSADMLVKTAVNSSDESNEGDTFDFFPEFDENDKNPDYFKDFGSRILPPEIYGNFLNASQNQKNITSGNSSSNTHYWEDNLDLSEWDGVDSEDLINPFSIQSSGLIPIIVISSAILLFIVIVYTDRKQLKKQTNYKGGLKRKNRYLY